MEKSEHSGIGTPVKKLSKQISQKYVQELVEEAIKRALKRLREKLSEKDILKLERKLKSLSDEEKINQFKKVIEKIEEKIPSEGINEELIEKISIEIEGKISSLLVSTAKMMLIAVIVLSTAAVATYFILQPQPPEAAIESITPNPAIEGDLILFIGSGAPDRSEDSITAYEWSLSNSILSGEDTFTTQNLQVGTHTIRFRVKDNNDKWSDPAISEIVVEPNNPPAAFIDSILPDTVVLNGTWVDLSGHGTDHDAGDSITAYEWSLNSSILSEEATVTLKDLSIGTHTIQFRVRDNHGKWSEPAISEIVVELNNPPVAFIESILPNTTVLKGTWLYFSGNGTDPDIDGSIAAYEWSLNSSILSEEAAFATQDLPVGLHTIRFRVRDNHGRWSKSVSAVIRVDPYAMFYVFRDKGLIVQSGLCDNGVKNCMMQGNISGGGYYRKIGDRIALNNNPDKLADLIIDHGVSAADRITLTVGETWSAGGWALTAQSIDARTKNVWLVLSFAGVKLDDRIVAEGDVYTYVEKSIAGESDVPLFVTYTDAVFSGATTDVVQLRYTWVVSRNGAIIIG
ncbi:MAG TPA: S-layer protein domain-containing protein [Candidatus Methanoperedens sp.]|nr:S-layer protein domain-containing protein [Candidatus Methanoperedens sp.]